jgi:hypothetical protein
MRPDTLYAILMLNLLTIARKLPAPSSQIVHLVEVILRAHIEATPCKASHYRKHQVTLPVNTLLSFCRGEFHPVRVLPCASLQPAYQLEREMMHFDYGAAAVLFPQRQRTSMMGAARYMRFVAAAEAIRYAVEEIPASSFRGTFLEVNEERFDANEIRRLYDSAEYPLSRQPVAIQDRLLSARRAS